MDCTSMPQHEYPILLRAWIHDPSYTLSFPTPLLVRNSNGTFTPCPWSSSSTPFGSAWVVGQK